MSEAFPITSIGPRTSFVSNTPRRCYACLFNLPPGVTELPRDLEGLDGDHFVNSIDVSRSADRGCIMCGHIQRLAVQEGFTAGHFDFCWFYEGSIIIMHSTNKRSSFYAQVYIKETDWLSQKGYKDLADLHPLIGLRRQVSGYTGSEVALARLREWFATCTLKHSRCRSGLTEELPHRILHIEDIAEPRVRLIEDCAEQAPFACLSHRWGSYTHASSLTKANLDQFRKQIPVSAWYPILKDAISVLYRLGIRYVWIDCLCIIQEDESDWRHEATVMADIYAKAAVTLFADCCKDDDPSLFRRLAKENLSHPTSVFLANGLDDNQEYVLDSSSDIPIYISSEKKYIAHPISLDQPHLPDFEQLEDSPELPLLQRGWVFQEWLLSRRIIHFTPQEIAWECGEAFWCECQYSQRRWMEMRARNSRNLLQQPWEDLIRAFTTRSLTRYEDKLPAVAGIAKRYAVSQGLTYIAGLWLETGISGLRWYRDSHSPVPSPRPDPLYAPTWSWASIPDKVDFEKAWSGAKSRECAKIEGYDIHPLPHSDEFGQLLSARLAISGPLVAGSVEWDTKARCFAFHTWAGSIQFNLDASIWESDQSRETVRIEASLLIISRPLQSDDEDYVYMGLRWGDGLVIRPAYSKNEEFERIGYCQTYPDAESTSEKVLHKLLSTASTKKLILV